MPISDIHLDSDLVTDTLRHPLPTPSLHPRNIRFWQTPHPTSVTTRPAPTFTALTSQLAPRRCQLVAVRQLVAVDNQRVFDFGIQGYQPHWLNGRHAVTLAHGPRLQSLVGRRLVSSWLVWDRDTDEWFADCPVLLAFDGEQVEINHQKFDDLSITWNTIDPDGQITWPGGDDNEPDVHAFHLSWRNDADAALATLNGQKLHTVELLEWASDTSDFANGMVAVSFVFEHDRVTITNALDENRLDYGPPHPDYHRHPLHT